MSVDEIIDRLKTPRGHAKTAASSYEASFLIELERPWIGYRDRHRIEVQKRRESQRVVIIQLLGRTS